MDSSKKFDNPSPEETTIFLSRLLFCWVLPFLKKGYKKGLQLKDIYNASRDDESGPLGDKLESIWLQEVENATRAKKKPSLKKAIFKAFGKTYGIFGIYLFIQGVILRSIHPLVLAQYIKYFEVTAVDEDLETGWLLASGVISICVLNFIIYHYCSVSCKRVGMRVRVACCSLVYRKLLRLNQTSIKQTAAGKLVNLLSNDVQRFDIASLFLHYLWLMPIQCVIGTYIIYRNVGLATITGMVFMILEAIPLQGYLSRLQGKMRSIIAEKTDHRIKLMNEIVSGIQVIKMYAWEKSFEKVVEQARKIEIERITWASYLKGLYLGLTISTERLCLYLTLVTFVLMGNRLSGDIVFSTAQLFNTIQLYMAIMYVTGLSTYEEVKVSIRRLEEFLSLEENHKVSDDAVTLEGDKTGYVKLKGLNATWLQNAIADTLMDINLEIKPGTLCCVIGNVGSGKSSLLQTLLKELPITNGRMEVHGNVSYASQEPWLFVSNVRSNILFGQPYVKPRYKAVVKACALEPDFKRFPYYDKTLVGERGVSLSGGQRARINLARSVYNDADIYLLDDPLSAVDTHVGKHLFEECIVKYLKDKTRILVTHQLQYLKQADLIVIMNNGKVEKVGTYDEMNEYELKKLTIEEHEDKEPDKDYGNLKDSKPKAKSIASFASSILSLDDEPEETQELIGKGVVPTSTYTEYLKNGASVPLLLFTGVFLIVSQLASNGADIWVTHWTNMEERKHEAALRSGNISHLSDTIGSLSLVLENYTDIQTSSTSTTPYYPDFQTRMYESFNTNYLYIIVYTTFIALSLFLTPLSRNLCFYIFMKASKVLHNKMFNNILQAPMRFFDTNPSGRILNRFSNDMGTMDEILPKCTLEAVQVFMVIGGILLLVFSVSPWMIIPAVILGILFYAFEVVYLTSAQDIKRLEGVTRAPVFSHITASMYGLSTIRSSNAERMVINEFDVLQDQHSGTWYLTLVCAEAFGFYLDVICLIFLICVTFQFLIFRDENTLSGNVGLVICQTMTLTGLLQLGPRATADVAGNMISVERILQYCKLDKEGPFESLPTKKPPHGWPNAGHITFKNTYLRYVLEEAPVLRNLNLEIHSGEKVGIVGRTGAGKSTLIASLFRLAPIEGTISIDGVDTAEVGLHDLRSKISIIPQEPVLFSNTVRYNLDPFGKANDETLWAALDKVELKGAIEDLSTMIDEGGSNFSAGQRQLICLARAIVRNNKVLVMDEATANVDQNTDNLIQKTIRQAFKDCTVLTIAHRLNTVIDSDKVLVMEAGEAVEFDHPYILLQNPDGYFSKMVQQIGKSMESNFKDIAFEDYKSKFGD